MKKLATLAALALIVGACSSDSATTTTEGATETTAAPATTTTAGETTTSLVATGDAAATCDAIKVGLFDLGDELQTAFADVDPTAEMSDEEAAELIFGPIMAFYASLGELAGSAPAEVAPHLTELSVSMEPLAAAIAAGDQDQLESMVDESGELNLDVPGAAEVDAWLADNCDIGSSLDPSVLIVETMMTAMFSGLGDALSELGSDLEDFGDFEDGFTSDGSNMVYGDDPELDALWDRCQTDDDEACDDLYWETFGLYELFAQTCGGRAPFHPDSGGACDTRMDAAGPSVYGDDGYLDSLWDTCAEGDAFSCEILAGTSAVGSDYERYGLTCGDTRAASARPCDTDGEAYTYGDDADLDELWDSCVAGDDTACSDLWFESPIGSEYETVGDACGALLDRDQTCDIVLELLDQPLG